MAEYKSASEFVDDFVSIAGDSITVLPAVAGG